MVINEQFLEMKRKALVLATLEAARVAADAAYKAVLDADGSNYDAAAAYYAVSKAVLDGSGLWDKEVVA